MSISADQPAEHTRNQILRSLDCPSMLLLLGRARLLNLPHKLRLLSARSAIDHVYFIETGVVSVTVQMGECALVGVGVVGREGLIGLPLALGSNVSSMDAIVQIGGAVRQMEAALFLDALESMPALREAVLRYTASFSLQMARIAASNALSTIPRRLAGRLLMIGDRVDGDRFRLTQECVAHMLGVQRPGISLAMARLQKEGLVEVYRGQVRILDRPALEAFSD